MSAEDPTQIADGGKTNQTNGSLVKVIVKESEGNWKCPAENEIFYINEEANFPKINFELDLKENQECIWTWDIQWAAATSGLRESKKRGRTIKQWTEKGKQIRGSNSWLADLDGRCLGGTLTVSVKANGKTFRRSVRILGRNPSEAKVKSYISTFEGIPGFERIISKESKYKQFINADGEPIVAFDGGYGLTQLTNPKPKYNEAWDWKANIRTGVELYRAKQKEAENYLKGGKCGKRSYTEEQLELETWCRWNSGRYHEWDEKNKKWIRNPRILDDNQTANIGWDITRPENKGKSEKELHNRDKDEYSKPPTDKSSWRYSGIVYADHIKND
jgi:hypothetical protein